MSSDSTPSSRPQVTLRDVAELADVSPRTVSNVVSGSVPVRPETRERVEQVIAALGYRPNLAARRLRSGRSHIIGLALPSVTVPYFRELTDSMLAAARRHDMSILVAQTHGDAARERTIVQDPYFRHVDGIVLAAVSTGQEDAVALAGVKPLVIAATSFRPAGVDTVDTDAFGAARAVVNHLVAGGRRHVAAILPGNADRAAEHDERYLGYLAGLEDAGLAAAEHRMVSANAVTLGAGAGAVRALLEQAPDTDAVFALGDALALGALRGLRDAGRTVPDEVAVVGFGNVAQSAHCTPTLSTVDPGQTEIAERSVALLVERSGAPAGRRSELTPRHHTVAYRLVVRESSGADLPA